MLHRRSTTAKGPKIGRRAERGLSLLEASVAICLIGASLAVFVPAFYRRVRASKLSEATTRLQQLERGVQSYYTTPHVTPHGRARACLPAQAGPAPAEVGPDPVLVDWTAEDVPGHETWSALAFAPDLPTRFRYSFFPGRSRCSYRPDESETAVTLRAEADLDDDGHLSRYERRLHYDGRGGLVSDGILHVRDRTE